MKTPKDIEDTKHAVKLMLSSGTPIGRIRSLLRGDQFSDAEIESILQSCPDYQSRVNELFQHRVVSGAACVLGFGVFFYYAFFAYSDWNVFFFAPLMIGTWGALKLYGGPSGHRPITSWGGKKSQVVDERKSSIKKYL